MTSKSASGSGLHVCHGRVITSWSTKQSTAGYNALRTPCVLNILHHQSSEACALSTCPSDIQLIAHACPKPMVVRTMQDPHARVHATHRRGAIRTESVQPLILWQYK